MVMGEKIRILAFAGSLRKKSYNKSILSAAADMVPGDTAIEIFSLEGIPPFNQDLEGDPPQRVRDFKTRIRAADAILVATPEYNYSIPGVLKNAIDWASRPYGDNAFDGKPVAIMGASPGMLGTARAQYHLRQCFIFLNMYPLNRPEVMVATANEKIAEDGKVTDEKTRRKIRELLEKLVAWTRKIAGEKGG
jgi:chromate reductase, NAD(P)H dehydrogenase (quinone)